MRFDIRITVFFEYFLRIRSPCKKHQGSEGICHAAFYLQQ